MATPNLKKDMGARTHEEAVAATAAAFRDVLHEWLTPAQRRDVVARNRREQDPNICHSHDFCDANMAMDEAFEKVFGHPASDYMDTEDDAGDDLPWTIWNQAWAIFARETREGRAF